MAKQFLRFMVAAALVVVSGSFAKADTYSIVSEWQIGQSQYGSQIDIAGDGTFTWNGTTFSNISFTFTETSAQSTACGGQYQLPCETLPYVLWTATPQDGQLSNANTFELGNSPAPGLDCSGTSCVTVVLSAPLTLAGSGHTWQGTASSSSQTPNTSFVSATVTDLPEPSAIALLGTVSGILGFVIFRRRKLVR